MHALSKIGRLGVAFTFINTTFWLSLRATHRVTRQHEP
jgi:hypothetical protein